MFERKVIYLILAFASIIFVVKPFIGYKFHDQLLFTRSKTVLVKAFAKRKPDHFEEASAKKRDISVNLNNPPLKENALLALLLGIFLPFIILVKEYFSAGIDTSYTKPPLNLLTCKLSI